MRRVSNAWKEARTKMEAAHADRRCYAPVEQREMKLLQRHAVLGEVLEPFPGMFALRETWGVLRPDARERFIVRAYARLHGDAVFCGVSAALMHGLPVSYAQLDALHLYAPPGRKASSTRHIVWHRQSATSMASVTEVDGVSAACMAQAVVESLCTSAFEDALAIGDGFLRRLKVERCLLQELVEQRAGGRRGVVVAREAARFADGRAESGGESVARGVMVRAGILPTTLQQTFRDPTDAQQAYRADFVFELRSGMKVLGEFDGRVKYIDEGMLAGRDSIDAVLAERQRESRLTMLGMPVVRFSWRDVTTPGRIERLLDAAGVTPHTLNGRDYLDDSPAWLQS